jgi:tetratricopeptide (TPR) repeat protein
MFRRTNRLQEALETATRIVELKPDDVLATMDVGDLNLALGNFDAAVAAYSRLRAVDTEPEHEVYAYHGMIQAEMLRDRWRRVLDLSIDATRVDRFGLTTDLLAFAVSQVFGASDRPAPTRAEIDASLAAELAEHRRLHTEELAL